MSSPVSDPTFGSRVLVQIGTAAARPLSDFSTAVLRLSLAGDDALELSASGSLDEPGLIAPFQRVRLRDENGAVMWTGWLDAAPRAATGTTAEVGYTLTGPMRWLERTPYTSTATGGRAPLVVPDESAPGDMPSIASVVRRVLAAVEATHPGRITWRDEDLDDALFASTQAVPETRLDSLCADTLRRALRPVPSAIWWWEYPAPAYVPRLRFADALASGANVRTAGMGWRLLSAQVTPRYDLLHDEVAVYWLKRGQLERTDTVSGASDAFSLGAARRFVATFEAGTYNLPADSIAQALHAFYSRLHADAVLGLDRLDWSLRPGHLVEFAPALIAPGVVAPTAITHTVVRDLFARTTTVELGVPPYLNITKLSDGNNDDSPDDPPTGTVSVTVMGLPEGAVARWQVGPATGQGSAEVEVPPGDYIVSFAPVWDQQGGRLYFAPSESVTVEQDQTASATGNYEALARLKLQPGGETPAENEIDLNTTDIPDERGLVKLRQHNTILNGAAAYQMVLASPAWPVNE